MSYYPPTDWELKDFYREHADALFRCCAFLTCGKADVSKMAQDIFMHMLTKGISFSSDKDAKAWMMLSAYKVSRKPPVPADDVTMAEAAAEKTNGAEEAAEPSETAHIDGRLSQTPEVPCSLVSMEFPLELRELSRKDRLIAAFYYCEGFRKAKIAKYLGWPTFRVSHRLRRIRRRILQEKGGDEAC